MPARKCVFEASKCVQGSHTGAVRASQRKERQTCVRWPNPHQERRRLRLRVAVAAGAARWPVPVADHIYTVDSEVSLP